MFGTMRLDRRITNRQQSYRSSHRKILVQLGLFGNKKIKLRFWEIYNFGKIE